MTTELSGFRHYIVSEYLQGDEVHSHREDPLGPGPVITLPPEAEAVAEVAAHEAHLLATIYALEPQIGQQRAVALEDAALGWVAAVRREAAARLVGAALAVERFTSPVPAALIPGDLSAAFGAEVEADTQRVIDLVRERCARLRGRRILLSLTASFVVGILVCSTWTGLPDAGASLGGIVP